MVPDLTPAVAATHLHAGVALAASVSLRPVQLCGLQKAAGRLPALPQCIVGEGQVELEIREPVSFGTRVSPP